MVVLTRIPFCVVVVALDVDIALALACAVVEEVTVVLGANDGEVPGAC